MKNLMILAAMLFIISMTSCSNEGNDPITLSEESNISMLSSYGARSLSSNDAFTQKLQLEDLPAISIKEANSILSAIKKHKNRGSVRIAPSLSRRHLRRWLGEILYGGNSLSHRFSVIIDNRHKTKRMRG